MTIGIFKSISKKNKLYKNFLKKPSYINETACKKYKNKLNHVANKTAKKAYYETQLTKFFTEIKPDQNYPILFYTRIQIIMFQILWKLLINLTNIL
jgi:hypothetical protein